MQKITLSLILLFYLSQATGHEISRGDMPIDRRCDIFSATEQIDFGKQTRGQLQPSRGWPAYLSPGKRTAIFTVSCPFSQPVQLQIDGIHNGSGQFRYGNQGALNVTLHEVLLDGHNVFLHRQQDNHDLRAGDRLQPGDLLKIRTLTRQKTQGKALQLYLDIEPLLSDEATRVRTITHQESEILLRLLD